MIAQIELALIARLKAVADAGVLPFAWRTLATYPDNWEDHLEKLTDLPTPAAWVVFAGWNSAEIVDDELVVEASFGLMVADRSERAEEQYQRHGSTNAARPGSYRLLIGAIAALAGQDLGLLTRAIIAGPARPVAATAASVKHNLSRYAVELRCSFAIALVGNLDEIDPDTLELLHANWDMPPWNWPRAIDADPVADGVQLPDDFHADATDHLTLENDL